MNNLMEWARGSSPYRGNARLIHICLAGLAEEEDLVATTPEEVASLVACPVSMAVRTLGRMERDGWLEVVAPPLGGAPGLYRLTEGGDARDPSPPPPVDLIREYYADLGVAGIVQLAQELEIVRLALPRDPALALDSLLTARYLVDLARVTTLESIALADPPLPSAARELRYLEAIAGALLATLTPEELAEGVAMLRAQREGEI